jgi:purine nucleosidase
LVSVTTVVGNQTFERTSKSALQILELADRPDIPVAAEMDRPLVRDPVTASEVHGEKGSTAPTSTNPPSSRRTRTASTS